MRFIVLGGVGDVGSVVTKDLAAVDGTAEVCIGDINLDKARKMSAELGAKVAARAIDINDKAGLVSALKGYDVAVNCVGPFYKHGSKVLEACVEARVNYVDICDDYDAAEVLLGLDVRCREAGITAIICQGASPGITNMMASLGAGKMDAEAIHTAWVESMMDVGGFVVFWHGFHMATGQVPQYLNGQWVRVPALDGAEELEFLQPLGRYPVYYLGHSEPVTIPRFIRGLKTVTNKGNMWPKETNLCGPGQAVFRDRSHNQRPASDKRCRNLQERFPLSPHGGVLPHRSAQCGGRGRVASFPGQGRSGGERRENSSPLYLQCCLPHQRRHRVVCLVWGPGHRRRQDRGQRRLCA